MSTMSDWIDEVCGELGIELADQQGTITLVLDLTSDVAHGVARPAAPVTAFLVGLAAGRSDRPEQVVAELADILGERAKAWSPGESA